MRRWKIKQGSYIGNHFIFDNEQEAALFLGFDSWIAQGYKWIYRDGLAICVGKVDEEDTFKHWANLKNSIGDWVRLCDGRIAQLLNWYPMNNVHRKYSVQEYPQWLPGDTIFVRFAFASTNIYIKTKTLELRYKHLHADFFISNNFNTTEIHRSNVSGRIGKMKKEKRLFVYYLAVVGNPVKAYHLAWPNAYKNKLLAKDITKRALRLMQDKLVIQEFFKYMSMEQYVEKFIKQAEDSGVDIKLFMEELKRGVTGAKAASDDHREMLKMLAAVLEKINNVNLLTNSDGTKKLESSNINSNIPLIPEPPEDLKDKINQNTPGLLG